MSGSYTRMFKDGSLQKIEYSCGDKCYYFQHNLHREDGPALDYANGSKYWFLHGKEIPVKTQEEFERYMRLKAFW